MFDRQPQRISYRIGGSLPPNAPTYVVRQADRELERYLQAGEFCYVLNSRQMGKSSLKLRTIQRLTDRGIACVNIDLNGVGDRDISAAQWYYSLADELATELDLKSELATFWGSHLDISDLKRLGKFIDKIVLEQIDRPIAIFIDEIDKVLSLGAFTDDFFGLIRNCAERRATSPKYQRLAFVLLGVATPSDLIKDKQTTPLNIGRSIELTGLQSTDDLSPLIQGLVGISANPNQTILEILDWTGGQPFLTQKICQLVVDSSHESILEIIQTQIIANWECQDHPVHLKTISNRLLGNEAISSLLLQQYRHICTSDDSLDANNSLGQQWLKLSGLVVERAGKLQVYNPIYARVFNIDWIDRALINICPHANALTDWLDHGRPDTLLLNGDALDQAIAWKDEQWQKNRSIGIEGADFIDRSQAKRTDRKLSEIKNRIRRFVKILSALIIVGLILLFALIWLGRDLDIAGKIHKVDSTSNQIIRQYEFAPIASLKAAIVNGNKFQDTLPIDSTPTPKLVLQKLVDSIQEIDEIHTHQRGVNSVYFCNDDRIFTAGTDGSIKLWNRDISGKSQKILDSQDKIKINSFTSENSACTNIFAAGSGDGSIRLWKMGVDTTQRKLPIEYQKAHQHDDNKDAGVQNVRLVRDRDDHNLYILSTGKSDGRLKKWRVENNHKLTLIWDRLAHKNGVISLNLNGDRDRIGTAGQDQTAKIWDLDGNLLQTLTGHLDSVNSINFCSTASQNCSTTKSEIEIATGSSDGTVRLWDADGKYIQPIDTHIGEVRAVRFSPDGKLLATASAKDPTASNGSSVRIWNLEDRKLVTEFKGHHGAIESMRFHPQFDGNSDRFQQLATSGYEDSIIRIWKIPPVISPNDKHQGKINSVRFDRADSRYFITAGADGTIRWWSHPDDGYPHVIDTFVNYKHKIEFVSIRIHPILGVKMIAASDTKGMTRLLKIEGDRIVEISSFDTEQGKIESIDWNYKASGDKSNLYLLATTGNINENIKIWAIDPTQYGIVNPKILYKNDWKISNLTVRFSEDGKNLLIGAEKGNVILIKNIDRLLDRPNVDRLKVPTDSKVTIGSSPKDDQTFTIVSHEGEIWRSTLEPKLINDLPIETYQAGTENIAISSKDNEIATGGAGAALRLWDLQGRQLADFRGYWGTIRSINFSKDGKYILAGGDDGIPRVWWIDRQIPQLIQQGCQWLAQGYLKSHSAAGAASEKINSSFIDTCQK
jgi:WD40 repeat protein